MIFRFTLAIVIVASFLTGCKQHNTNFQSEADNPIYLHRGIRLITDIIRNDIFAPPVASRIYAYSTVAAYEALIPGHPEYKSLAGQLNGLNPCPKPEVGKEYCFPLASLNALLTVGKTLIFSEGDIQKMQDSVFSDFKKMNLPPDVFDRSMTYGDAVAQHIIAWSKQDNYNQTRSAPKFSISTNDLARWTPTPPTYSDALEPHWKEIRPWVLDSAGQFKPVPHIPFSTAKNSAFYKAAMEVYEIGQNLTEADKETALYWDCNPFEVTVSGHLMVSTKKISPGGHWMNIAATVCKQENKSTMQSTEVYTMVALALSDAFISCWREKYTANLVRPITYINQYIDPQWTPYIETPNFPEHTSGHATISAAAATVLTQYFGEAYGFTDSTETIFGLAPRRFRSFYEAADQVALSRLYGGIHYRIGNEGGRINGRDIGKYVLGKLTTHI
jgi:hypothetical protein